MRYARSPTDDSLVADFAIYAEQMGPPFPLEPVLAGAHPLKSHEALVRGILRGSGALLGLAALGGVVLLVRRARGRSLASRALVAGSCAAALYTPLVSAAIAVNGRHRWPVEDALMPLAGLFVARATSRTRPDSWDERDTPPSS